MNWSLVKIIVLFESINTRINRPKYEYESFIFCFSIRQVRIHFIIRHTILFLSLVPHLQQLKIHCRNICRTKWESEVIAWNVVMAKGVIWKQPVIFQTGQNPFFWDVFRLTWSQLNLFHNLWTPSMHEPDKVQLILPPILTTKWSTIKSEITITMASTTILRNEIHRLLLMNPRNGNSWLFSIGSSYVNLTNLVNI